jgi:DNA-binding XRE family transcriptional regulator
MMKNPRIGSKFSDHVKELERKSPGLRALVEEHKEKAVLAQLIKAVREAEGLTQQQVAKKAGLPQSAIARMESATPSHHPSVVSLNKVFAGVGYRLRIVVQKGKNKLEASFA